MGWSRRLPRRITAVRGWELWALPRWLVVFLLAVIAGDLAALGIGAGATTIRKHDLVLFAVLLGCTVLAVELSRKAGEQGGVVLDVQGVWERPVAILLPPFYSLVVPVIHMTLVQLRVRRAPLHRRAFSAAAISLSYAGASVAFHGLSGMTRRDAGGPAAGGAVWILLVLASVLVQWVLNKGLIMTAVKGNDPATSIRTQVLGREPLYNDIAEICISVLVIYGVAGNMLLALAALPVVTLLQRSLRHVQLLNDSRADSKTGLLNAATWERESAAELARAMRTKTPLAVALLDIDRFKGINDTYGHMTGDEVLKGIAHALKTMLREYDLAGRFGGEEFSLLLPHTRAVDAFRIAERVRATIASLNFIAPGTDGAERVNVTVSIGVATLEGGSERKLPELMAAADAALYRAKGSGRDQVQMISSARGLSVASGTAGDAREDKGGAKGNQPDAQGAMPGAQIS